MSTATAPAAPALAAQAPAPQPAPAVDHAATFRTDASAVQPDAINQLLGKRPAVAPAPAPAAAPIPAAAPASVPAVQPAPQAPQPPVAGAPVAQPEQDGTPESKLPNNWRLTAKDPKEALFMLEVRKGKGVDAAFREVYGIPAPTATAAAPAASAPVPVAEPSPTLEIDNQITTLGQQAKQLQADLDKAIKDGDTVTALTLQEKKFDVKLQTSRLEDQRVTTLRDVENSRVNAVVSKYQQAQAKSADAALAEYPSMQVETGQERAVFNERVAEMRKDPANLPFFDSPNWPLLVTRALAAEHGWVKGGMVPPAPAALPTPAPQPAAPAPATRATAAEIVTAPAPTNGTTFAPTVDQFKKDAHRFTPEALNDLLKAPRQQPLRAMH